MGVTKAVLKDDVKKFHNICLGSSRDSPLAQLVEELDLCLFQCVIKRPWD